MNLETGGLMSKVSIAIAAFALGFLCSRMLGVPQTQHPGPPSPTVDWPDRHTLVFHGGGIINGGFDMASIGAVPFFNSLNHMPVFRGFTFLTGGKSLNLDGLNCEDCQFDNAQLRYGGGVVNLKGSTFSGTTELQLEGAAANTVALLEFLRAIPGGRLTYKLPIRNRPIIRKFPARQSPGKLATPSPAIPPQKMDFTAPYIGQK